LSIKGAKVSVFSKFWLSTDRLGDVVEADHAHQHALVHHRHVARMALQHHAADLVQVGFQRAGERMVVHRLRTSVVPTCRRC
jgi:hypothetical protein